MAFKDSMSLKIAQRLPCFRSVEAVKFADKVVGYKISFLPALGLSDIESVTLTDLVVAGIAAVTEKAIEGAKHE